MQHKKLSKTEWLFGRHPVADYIRSGQPVEKVFIQQGLRGETEIEIRNLCKQAGIPMQVIPKDKLNRMAPGKNHQGIIAQAGLVNYYKISDVLPHIFETGETPLILLADRITDVGNFGAMARSAECMGVHAIVVPEKDTARIHEDAMKSSAGALSRLRICRESSLVNAIEFMKNSGCDIVSLAISERAVELQMLDLSNPLCLILGSEDEGISPALLKRSDHLAFIPQTGETQSLNVSVATGIALYETLRQRSSQG